MNSVWRFLDSNGKYTHYGDRGTAIAYARGATVEEVKLADPPKLSAVPRLRPIDPLDIKFGAQELPVACVDNQFITIEPCDLYPAQAVALRDWLTRALGDDKP